MKSLYDEFQDADMGLANIKHGITVSVFSSNTAKRQDGEYYGRGYRAMTVKPDEEEYALVVEALRLRRNRLAAQLSAQFAEKGASQ